MNMTFLRPKALLLLLIISICFFLFWPRIPQQKRFDCPSDSTIPKKTNGFGPLSEATRSTIIIDSEGNPREYLNAKGYVTFLDVLIKQHQESIGQLIRAANIAVANNSVYSVTLKPQMPPSGDIHDYLSLSRYFWPNPSKPDGLPYIRKDGYTNPEFFSVQDYTYLRKMFREVQDLGFAYHFTRNESYVEKALFRIKEWFLNEETKMNPNLNFAGLRKGLVEGWKSGVLDFHQVFRMLQGMKHLRNSNFWDKDIDKGLNAWLSEYYIWLTTSNLGTREGRSINNHGTFYDVQVLFILEYLGRYDQAKKFIQSSLAKRIGNGILETGEQHYETERPTSWFYSVFNLQGLFMLAERADHYGIDGWNYRGRKGQGIKKAVDFLLPYALKDGEGWPFHNIKGYEMNEYVRLLELSFIIYRDDKYLKAIEVLLPKAKTEQAAGVKIAKWEDNYLCNLALLTNREIWTCLF